MYEGRSYVHERLFGESRAGIYRVTCPGVWLCTNGKISLQLKMLDSKIQTQLCRPVFPLPCNEKYVFTKTFYKHRKLIDLQKALSQEDFYAELVHWKSCDEGYVLARFYSALDDLLYPPSIKGNVKGKETDLLMEPTSLFPGSIAPKLEISTKTTIEEIFRTTSKISHAELVPKKPNTNTRKHPRRVCHSIAYSKAQKPIVEDGNKRPPFMYRRVSDDFLLRKNNAPVLEPEFTSRKTNLKPSCHCYCTSKNEPLFTRVSSSMFNDHADDCSICTTYDQTFLPRWHRCRSENVYDYPKLCPCCKASSGKGKSLCNCLPSQGVDAAADSYRSCASNLVHKLHTKLNKVLDTDCIECKDLFCESR
nr:unnamed protein product [Callosobruchus analis]